MNNLEEKLLMQVMRACEKSGLDLYDVRIVLGQCIFGIEQVIEATRKMKYNK